jgi:hypothetical protein
MNTTKQRLTELEKAAPKPPRPEPEPLTPEQLEAEARHVIASCDELIDYCERGWLRWDRALGGTSTIPRRDQRPGRGDHYVYNWWYTVDCPVENQRRAIALGQALDRGIDQWSLRTGGMEPDNIPEVITWLEMTKTFVEEWLESQ